MSPSSRPGVRFQTRRSWPASTSRRALRAPIAPQPRNATRLMRPPPGGRPHPGLGALRDLEPLIIDRDPRPVERHWQTMTRGPYFKGGIAMMSAISAIDQALWDIKAKDLGVPLYELLGVRA